MDVYIEVTRDKFELPIRIADSVKELAKLAGVTPNNVSSAISHYEHRAQKSSRFYRVSIDYSEEEE